MYGTLGSEDWTPNKSVVMASTVVIPSAVLAGIDWLSIQNDICRNEPWRENLIRSSTRATNSPYKGICYTIGTSLRSRRFFPFSRRWNRASERAKERAWGEQKEEEKREWVGRKGILPYPHPLLPIFRTRSQLRSLCERFVYVASSDANLLEQKSVNIRKEFNSRSIALGQQHGRRFCCFKTPIWLPWRHMKTKFIHYKCCWYMQNL